MPTHRLNTWRSAAGSRLIRPLRHRTPTYTLRPQPVVVFYGPELRQIGQHRCGAYVDANRLGPQDTCRYCTLLPTMTLDHRTVDNDDAVAAAAAHEEPASTLETYGIGPDGATNADTPRLFTVLTSWLTAFLAREWQMTPEDFDLTYTYDDSLMVLDEAERCSVRHTGLYFW